VLKSFYNHKNSLLLNEVAGSSSAVVEVSTDFRPLTDLLFLVSGNKKIRARVLMWIMGQGLMEASFAREKLLEEVKKVANGLESVDDAKLTPKSASSSRRAVGMRMEHARFSNFGSFYGKDSDDLDIDSMDLFSPEAYKRIPILKLIDQEKKMNGRSIFEYWLEKYEPKKCLVNQGDTKNRHFVYDFEEIRKAALSLGLKPFYFGGFNGLIQFMEKGDWKSDVEKKSYLSSRNNQFGIDLRPEFEQNKEGKRIKKGDLISFDEDGKGKRPVYHFQGGGIVSDEVASTSLVNSLNNHFSDLSAAVQRKESEHPDIKDYDSIVQSDARSLKSKSDDEDDEDAIILGDHRFANALGFDNAIGGSRWKKLPNLTNLPQEKWKEVFKNILIAGLQLPITKKRGMIDTDELYYKTFGNEKFSDTKEDYDGWFSFSEYSGLVTFKLSKQQQKEVFDAVTARLDNNEYLSRVQLSHIPSLKNLAIKKDGKVAHNQRLSINVIINNALKNNPGLLKDFNIYIASPKKDLSQIRNKFEFVANDEKFELQDVNPDKDDLDNPIIRNLFTKGFRWNSPSDKPFEGLIAKLDSPKKQIMADPSSDDPDMGSPDIRSLMRMGFNWKDINKKPHPFKNARNYDKIITKEFLVKEAEQYEVTFNKKENKFYLKPIIKTSFSLTNGPDSFKVSLERDENNVLKFYFYKPSFKDDIISLVPRSVVASPKSKSREFPFVGSKDIMFKGGNKTSHFTGNVAGPQDWQTLLQRLKQGRKGGLHEFEKGDSGDKNYDELNLPSVVGGVALAKKWFNSSKSGQDKFLQLIGSQLGGRGGKWASDWFVDDDLLQWGFESLKQFSGTRWFQIGWISDDELKQYIGEFHSKGIKKTNNIDQEIELLKAQKVYHGDYFDDITELNLARKSRLSGDATIGIKPLLLKYGAIDGSNNGETPEERNELLKALEKVIEQIQERQNKSRETGKILIDYIREMAPESADALAENGFKFRQRMIGKYVLDQMTRRVKELSKKTTMTGLGGGDDEEEGGGFEIDSGMMVSRSSSDTYDTGRQRVSASDLPSGEIVSPETQSKNKTPKKDGLKQQNTKVKRPTTSALSGAGESNPPKQQVSKVIRPTVSTVSVAGGASPPNRQEPANIAATSTVVTDTGARGVTNQVGSLVKRPQLSNFPITTKKENFNINLLSYSAWKKIQETTGTYAIVSKKPKDGDGYNVWGSLGKTDGVSIAGDANTSKIDPIGKKGSNVSRKRKT